MAKKRLGRDALKCSQCEKSSRIIAQVLIFSDDSDDDNDGTPDSHDTDDDGDGVPDEDDEDRDTDGDGTPDIGKL